jgi:hypothetical protein
MIALTQANPGDHGDGYPAPRPDGTDSRQGRQPPESRINKGDFTFRVIESSGRERPEIGLPFVAGRVALFLALAHLPRQPYNKQTYPQPKTKGGSRLLLPDASDRGG